jgi:hypothetical protein
MKISELTRRNIIDYLLVRDTPYYGRSDLISFLKRTWNLSSMPSTDIRFENAEGDIWQHMVNNYDWDDENLLTSYLDLLNCDDAIFLKFLENCVHPIVLYDDKVIEETLATFNSSLENDGYRLEEHTKLSGKPVYKAFEIGESKNGAHYEIVLSFAGEDRDYVESVAKFLISNGVSLFYDKYEEVTLWGKDLEVHLEKVYSGTARYCVVFISEHYAKKLWPSHEMKSALKKAVAEKEEYILPARFDDTEIPGLSESVACIDISNKSPEDFGLLILKKLGRKVEENNQSEELI